MDMELEGRPAQPLMLKEWLELESSAELSRDGFGCYPRHLAAELRSASGRRRNGDVIARVSAAVRGALFPPPPGREEQAALSRNLSRRLRVGFWKKRRGQLEERDTRVASCSATVASGRRDGSSSPAMAPRRMSWEGRQAGGAGASLGSHRSHETEVVGCECETSCHLDEELEQEQRLSPVSVMDFLSQDEDDGNDGSGGNGHSEDDGDDEIASPKVERSLANVGRASQHLLQQIQPFEQLAEPDTSDVDDATMIAEDTTSCHVGELDSTEDDEDAEGGSPQDLQSLPEASSSCAAHCFRKLLEDFFRDGLSPCHADDPNVEKSLLATAKAWLDGRHCTPRLDGKEKVEEIEHLGRWKCFREDEQELLAFDMEGSIFWSLMDEFIDELW